MNILILLGSLIVFSMSDGDHVMSLRRFLFVLLKEETFKRFKMSFIPKSIIYLLFIIGCLKVKIQLKFASQERFIKQEVVREQQHKYFIHFAQWLQFLRLLSLPSPRRRLSPEETDGTGYKVCFNNLYFCRRVSSPGPPRPPSPCVCSAPPPPRCRSRSRPERSAARDSPRRPRLVPRRPLCSAPSGSSPSDGAPSAEPPGSSPASSLARTSADTSTESHTFQTRCTSLH